MTLQDFFLANSQHMVPKVHEWQRQKLWITPNEINLIKQNIERIPEKVVDTIH